MSDPPITSNPQQIIEVATYVITFGIILLTNVIKTLKKSAQESETNIAPVDLPPEIVYIGEDSKLIEAFEHAGVNNPLVSFQNLTAGVNYLRSHKDGNILMVILPCKDIAETDVIKELRDEGINIPVICLGNQSEVEVDVFQRGAICLLDLDRGLDEFLICLYSHNFFIEIRRSEND